MFDQGETFLAPLKLPRESGLCKGGRDATKKMGDGEEKRREEREEGLAHPERKCGKDRIDEAGGMGFWRENSFGMLQYRLKEGEKPRHRQERSEGDLRR